MATMAEALARAGQYHLAGNLQAAEQVCRDVLRVDPTQPDALHRLALLASQSGRPEQAAEHLTQALARQPNNPTGHVNLGVINRQLGKAEEAERCFREALRLRPEDNDARFQPARTYQMTERWDEVAACCRQLLQAEPNQARVHDLLAVAQAEQGLLDEALASFDEALRLRPDHAETHNNRAKVFLMQGRLEEAEVSFREALRRDPAFTQAHMNLGRLLLEQRQWEQAADSYRAATRTQPQLADAHYQLGRALAAMEKREEAVASFRQTVRLAPDNADAHFDLANILRDLALLEETEASLREVLRLRPDFAAALNNLSNTLGNQNKLDEALEIVDKVLRIDPTFAFAHANRAVVLFALGRTEDAEASCRETLRLLPDHAGTYINLGAVLCSQALLEEGLHCFREALRLKPEACDAFDNLLLALNYHPDFSSEDLFKEHCRWASIHAHPEPPPAHRNRRDPERRLRVGYVSPDFRLHPVSYFLGSILQFHDRRRVQPVCYTASATGDAVTEIFKALASDWRSTLGLKDAQLADQVRRDDIDILVDLTGHTGDNRLRMFSHKPAPVQVTYLGYPNTTGLRAIDYLVTDAVVDPPGEPEFYTEELVRLPGGFCCYRAPDDAPPPGPLPADRAGRITFGALHAPARLNGQVLDLWAAILRAVPSARLLICRHTLTTKSRDYLRRALTERGAGDEQVDFRYQDIACLQHWPLYLDLDVSLDTFPWSGHTTACESLWMGVPVVTLRGTRHAGRMVASVLTQMGLTDWIAETPEQYVAMAVAAANDLDRLRALRVSLRERARTGPLCDGRRFTRELEDAYRTMWRRWCAS